MTDWDRAADDYVADLARRPAARQPSTLSEVWDSEWKRSGLDTLTGVGKPLDDAYDDLVRGVETATGKPIVTFLPAAPDSYSTDARARLIGEAIAGLPDEVRKPLEPLLDVRRRASEKAHKTEIDAAEIYANATGLSGVATSWMAGIARQAVDPVNLATLPLGGPLKGPVLKMLLREAGIGGVTQAVQEPAIQTGRAELGLEAGFGQGATNVAQAALGAAGMAGLFRAGAWGLRAVRGQSNRAAESAGAFSEDGVSLDTGGVRNNAPVDSAVSRLVEPEDLAAAARVAERDQMVDAAAPVRSPEGVAAHAQAVQDAGAALERGAPIPADAAPPPQPEIIHGRDFTGKGAVDMGAVADDVAKRVETALSAGAEVTYFVEGKPVRIVSIDRGMMADAEGQRWGVMHLLSPSSGKRTDIEIVPRAPEVAAIEPSPRTEAPPPPRPTRGPRARPEETWSLFEFIAARGGLKPDPELALLFGGSNPFVPGFGPLIRKTGLPLDRAREAAVEARYLTDAPAIEAEAAGGPQNRPSESTVRNLLDALDRQARGERQYRMGQEGRETAADARARAEREAADVAREIDARFREAEIDPATVDPILRKRVTEMFTREGETDVAVAFERAVMEDSERFERASRARRETTPDIPGWDFPDDGGRTPGGGGKPARRSGPGGAEDRGQSRDGGPADRAPGEGGETGLIGDPILAREVERVIAQHGDFEIHTDGGKLKFSEAMRLAAADDRAARELVDCIGAAA